MNDEEQKKNPLSDAASEEAVRSDNDKTVDTQEGIAESKEQSAADEPAPLQTPETLSEDGDNGPADTQHAEPTTELGQESFGSNQQTAQQPVPEMASPTTYRWTYADQAAHENAEGKKNRHKGLFVYATVMTIVLAISISLLIFVLVGGNQSFLPSGGIIQRPGVEDPGEPDDAAIAAIEQAKYSVVVIEASIGPTTTSTGTGIVLTENGYLATNYHVIEGARSIRVTFYDGKTVSAEVVGSSEIDDLAVLKVNRRVLRPAVFAKSKDCYVGQPVYAIGTPASAEFGWTTTRGIISYKDRAVRIYNHDGTMEKTMHLLQTDAEANPGNSGGPLVNVKGEVVGIVSLKMANGYTGINFAIPSDGAVEILEAIIKYGDASSVDSSVTSKRPVLGIVGVYVEENNYYRILGNRIQPITEEEYQQSPENAFYAAASGVYVTAISEGTHAGEVLEPGDIICSAEDQPLLSQRHLSNIINGFKAGDKVHLTVRRGEKTVNVELTLSEMPAQPKN